MVSGKIVDCKGFPVTGVTVQVVVDEGFCRSLQDAPRFHLHHQLSRTKISVVPINR
jgi:hypothetical protein